MVDIHLIGLFSGSLLHGENRVRARAHRSQTGTA